MFVTFKVNRRWTKKNKKNMKDMLGEFLIVDRVRKSTVKQDCISCGIWNPKLQATDSQ